MSTEISIVTANFGRQEQDVEFPLLPEYVSLHRYSERTVDYPWMGLAPRLRAKYFKCQMHRLDLNDRWFVWADNSLQFHSLEFLKDIVDRLSTLSPKRRAMFIAHPDRGTVREEYEFLLDRMANHDGYLIDRYGLDNLHGLMQQVDGRRKLLCGGFFVIENGPFMQAFLNDWWDMILRYGVMDQLSLPEALAKNGIEPELLPVYLYRNEYFEWQKCLQSA